MSGGLTGRQGTVVWAISGFEVATPFRVAHHDGSQTEMTTRELAEAVRDRELAPDFELIIGAKLRPVLLLQDRPASRFSDYAALRLTRVEKFAAADQQRIRSGQEETLFYLPKNKSRYGLAKEHAVLLTSLHRVHASAVASAQVGQIDQAEFRTICERLVRVCDLDISNLIVSEAADFIRQLRERDS